MRGLVLVAALLPVAAGAVAPQRQFKSSTDVVRLEVGVTNERGHLDGLAAADFIVEDRGKRQRITVEKVMDAPLDVMLVAPPVSAVNFVAADQVRRYLAGIDAAFDQVQERDRLGIVLAGSPPRLTRGLDRGRGAFGPDVVRSISDTYMSSFDAIALGLAAFDQTDRRRVMVTFTSPADFRSVITAQATAELSKRLDNAMVVVALPVSISSDVYVAAELTNGTPIGMPVEGAIRGHVLPVALERFVDATRSRLVNLGSGAPAALMSALFESLRTYYVVTYDMPEGTGWHPVKVKVHRSGAKVAVRQGYYVE